MNDKVVIEGLSVMTTVGVYDWEQHMQQKVVLDVIMDWNNKLAGKSDNINDCLNYAEVSQTIVNFLNNNRFFLIEKIAEEVAELVMSHFLISKVKIKVSKPGAVATANNVAVIIERAR